MKYKEELREHEDLKDVGKLRKDSEDIGNVHDNPELVED